MCPVKEEKKEKPITTLIKPSSNYNHNLQAPYIVNKIK